MVSLLEVDRGREKVRLCRILTSLQEGPHQKLFLQEFFQNFLQSNMANFIIVDIVNYLILLLDNS